MGILNWLFGKKSKNFENLDSTEEFDAQDTIDDSNNEAMKMFKKFEELNTTKDVKKNKQKQKDKDSYSKEKDLHLGNYKKEFSDLNDFKSIDFKKLTEKLYKFIAVDVETANSDKDSICQIGLALVSMEDEVKTIGVKVNPEQPFDSFNTSLHGIDESQVEKAPNFEKIMYFLRKLLENNVLIQHSNFDKQAFDAACTAYAMPKLKAKWLDSVLIARNTWPELKDNGGHGLANLKVHLNLVFTHHDAEEDAKASAQITLLAEKKTGKTFFELAELNKKKVYQPPITMTGNEAGKLFGQVVCFTGQLGLSRLEASTLAANAGLTVKAGVSKKVNLVVVGDQDLNLLAGHKKSTKHRRAEELIDKGQNIKIIGESEFVNLVSLT